MHRGCHCRGVCVAVKQAQHDSKVRGSLDFTHNKSLHRLRLRSYFLCNISVHLQCSYSPVAPRFLAGLDEQRQADEVDGGSDGQRADVLEHDAHQSREAQEDLEQRGHQDGALDLWRPEENEAIKAEEVQQEDVFLSKSVMEI